MPKIRRFLTVRVLTALTEACTAEDTNSTTVGSICHIEFPERNNERDRVRKQADNVNEVFEDNVQVVMPDSALFFKLSPR